MMYEYLGILIIDLYAISPKGICMNYSIKCLKAHIHTCIYITKNHQQIIAAYRSNSWVLMRQRYIEDE